MYLKRHPLCVHCGAQAAHVDHIVSRQAAPELALEWANLQGLCVPCHTRKTCLLYTSDAADDTR